MNILKPNYNPDKRVIRLRPKLFGTQIIHILLQKKIGKKEKTEIEQTNKSNEILIKQLQELWINPQNNEIEQYRRMNLNFEKLKQLQELWINFSRDNIWKFNKLALDIEIIKKLKEIWNTEVTNDYRNLRRYNALWLTNEDLEFIKEYHLTSYHDIYYFLTLKNNTNKKTISNYLQRKHGYLEKHRTISEEKFIELFWWKWKYNKTEINQKDIEICFAYTGFEILKKTNCFNELIQTNLRELPDWNWREVRFPMWDQKWKRIKVYKDEINQKFKRTDKKTWEKYEVSINSISEFLWFKILEIAFMKAQIINAPKSINRLKNNVDYFIIKKAISEYENTWRITFNEELINYLEWWYVNDLYETIMATWTDKQLTHLTIKKGGSITNNIKDLTFNYFNTWMIQVEVAIQDKNIINNGYEITKEDNIPWIIVQNAKIINTSWYTKKTSVKFYTQHSYSIQKCYTDSVTWEKRVWIVNPRNTWIKYDISLNDAKSIFIWDISKINIDKMFQEERA